MRGKDRHTANDQLEGAAVQDGAVTEGAFVDVTATDEAAADGQPDGAAAESDGATNAAVTGKLDAAAVEGVAGAAAAVAEHAKSAEEYRQTADEHVKTLKDFWKDFLVSGIFILAAIVIIFACLAWFAANSKVSATGSSISAKGPRFALMVQDDVAKDGKPGAYTKVVSGSNYMLVNENSNFNDFNNGDELFPGASGKFKLKVHRYDKTLKKVTIKLDLKPSSSVSDAVSKLLLGHIQFFYKLDETSNDAKQFYDDAKLILPTADKDNNFSRSFEVDFGSSDDRVFEVYWVWPSRFVNYIATGGGRYDNNLFSSQTDGYDALLAQLNNQHDQFFADTKNIPKNINNNIGNEEYNTCTEQYDKADDEIADSVDYLTVSFQAGE